MLANNRQKLVYLDNAATTKIDSRVLNVMLQVFTEEYGNASSLHSIGTQAKEILNSSRTIICSAINCKPDEIIFTSGGTESNNLALQGVAYANIDKGKHIIVSSIEHDCVLNTCKYLKEQGFYISYLPVDHFGTVDIEMLEKLINPKTILVSVMHANNEIGTIQPIEEIGRICRNHNVLFHSDACQSFGKIPVDVQKLNVDLLTLNSHKIHGPKGVGALYINRKVIIRPIFYGGGQENNIRPSTENIPGIAGFAEAARIATDEMPDENIRLIVLRDKLFNALKSEIEGIYLNGHPFNRLPSNLNFSIKGLEGEAIRLLFLLDESGICVSGGSACSSNNPENGASHVHIATGKNQFEARGAIRISLGRFNNEDDINYFSETFFQKIRKLNPIFT